MSYSFDVKDQLATFQFEVTAESFAHELEKEIFRSKDKMNLSVYRDGKVPPEVVQEMYDRNEMVKRVINRVIGTEYENAIREQGFVPLTAPLAKVLNCKKGEPFTFTLDTIIKPEIQLSKYNGVLVPAPDFTVPEEHVDGMIADVLKKNAKTVEVTDRPVEDGDHLLIDFEGFLHGRPFKGNKADNFPLTIGSHSFIPGFEEELIGVGLNEAKDFNITYPADYRLENLAGQEVVFRVIVRRITQVEVPELTDEYVKANTKYDSVDTYKAELRKSMEFQKRLFELKKKENEVLKSVVEGSKLPLVEKLVNVERKRVQSEQEEQLKKRGVKLEQHLKMIGQTEAVYQQQLTQIASNRVKTRLVLLEIAQRENIVPTEEEINKEISMLAKNLKKPEDTFRHPFSKSQIENEVKIQKALRFVMEHAIEVNQSEEK